MSSMTILMDQYKVLKITQSRVLYQAENYVDDIQFIVPKYYNDIDLQPFICTLEYVDAASNAHLEILTQDEDLYKESYLRYTLPVTTEISHVAGDLKMQLTMNYVDETTLTQYTLHSSELTLTIHPVSDYYMFSDASLNKIDKLIGELGAKADYIAKTTEYLATQVPDDLAYDDEGTLHLEVGTKLIGTGQNVGTIAVSDDEDENQSDGIINLNDIYSEVTL